MIIHINLAYWLYLFRAACSLISLIDVNCVCGRWLACLGYETIFFVKVFVCSYWLHVSYNFSWFTVHLGFVGEYHPEKSDDHKHLLFTHKNIFVRYNGDQVYFLKYCSYVFFCYASIDIPSFLFQIIHVNLTQDNLKPLEAGKVLDLTYSVKWMSTNVSFARRFDVYLDYPFFEHQVICLPAEWHFYLIFILISNKLLCLNFLQIHWFSIFNSFMMVIFLTGLVSMILMRTLRNDYAKYAREDDDLETLVAFFSHSFCIYFNDQNCLSL